MNRLFSVLLIGIILFYKGAISPLFSPRCRYTPTCSDYGLQAIKKHGPYKGLWLSVKRFLTCFPWGGHGHDPVP